MSFFGQAEFIVLVIHAHVHPFSLAIQIQRAIHDASQTAKVANDDPVPKT